MNFIKSFKKLDIVIILLLIGFAIILYAVSALKRTVDSGVYAEIIYSGNIICTVDLNESRTFYIPELPHISFEVKDGKIAFTESDCPDKICVKTGFISIPGQTAACVPNKTVLHINRAETNANDIDAIVQ